MTTDALWRSTLLAVLAPALVLGFLASALANRLVFAGWGLAVAAVLVPVLRRSFELWLGRPGGGARSAAAAAFVLAPALGAFAWLAGRHHEILDLGARAVLPGLYSPAATAPATWWLLAGALAAAGVASRVVARRARKLHRSPAAGRGKETSEWRKYV